MEEEDDLNYSPPELKKSVLILANPRAGQGGAAEIAARLCAECAKLAPEIVTFEGAWPSNLRQKLERVRAVIIAGGDGTLLHLLPLLAETRVPFYIAGAGNENLFEREFFGHGDVVLERLERCSVMDVPLGSLNGRLFATMASVGLDSEVIRDIAVSRCQPIGHGGYVVPLLRASLHHHIPSLTITADGDLWVEKERGYFIAANTKQYARRVPLAPAAVPDPDTLFGTFIPYRSLLFYLSWLPRALTGRAFSEARTIRAREFLVDASPNQMPVQADGEYFCETPAVVRRERLAVKTLK